MRAFYTILTLFLASTTIALCLVPAEETQLALVQAVDKAWADAAASKDVDRMLSFYTDDAVFIAPNGSLIKGKDDLQKLWSRFFKLPSYSLTWTATKVEASKDGTVAYSYGTWEESRVRDDKKTTQTGTYLAVWKKQTDGSWKVAVDKP